MHLAVLAAPAENVHAMRAVEVLLDAGADVAMADAEGNIPLHLAVLMKNPRMVTTLLEYGSLITVANKFGETPVEMAARTAAVTCLELVGA